MAKFSLESNKQRYTHQTNNHQDKENFKSSSFSTSFEFSPKELADFIAEAIKNFLKKLIDWFRSRFYVIYLMKELYGNPFAKQTCNAITLRQRSFTEVIIKY